MISHLTLGTNNLTAAIDFYDQLLQPLHAKKVAKTEQVVFYAFKDSGTKLAITQPHNGELATSGNGTMLALRVTTQTLVETVYNLALSLGAQCEGKPGERDNGAYFAAYFRDLDTNKLVVFHRADTVKR
ncbi:VOC family protein [Pseudoalteromonas sp. SMS1]|uniref:VOC family protein n=1 Tax=Pseudoalteromonas sp. SMS1 TaxID=2908894 RepID=UPI001F3E6027|nr:VOC family protein [Pseudoalteromonas sp. SMS1]MCF2859794.1 VOC family protein [Pseudoalteromonas sp. SMS1]